jgi:hypothetical protein
MMPQPDVSAVRELLFPPQPAEKANVAEQAEEESIAPEVVEETLDSEEEVVAEESQDVEGQEEESSEPEEIPEIEDLHQLAAAIEVDPSFLYDIKIPLSDGKDPVTLSELKDAYQGTLEETSQLKQQLEAERANFENEVTTQRQEVMEQLQQFQQFPTAIQEAEAEAMLIAQQYESFDWKSLEESDPGQAALQKQNMATAFQLAQTKATELKQQFQNELQANHQKIQEAQRTRILQTFPEWQDADARNKGLSEIGDELAKYGYDTREIQNIADSRALKIVSDLLELKKKASEAQKTMQKVRKTPKTLRTTSRPEAASAQKKLQAEIETAKAATRPEDKLAAIGKLIRQPTRGKPHGN